MPVRVLHLSTFNEVCGIATYQEEFLRAMRGNGAVANELFETSISKVPGMDLKGREAVYARLAAVLADFDVVHVQHEFSYFPDYILESVVETAKKAGKKVVVTVHTGISAVRHTPWYSRFVPYFPIVGPRSIVRYARFVVDAPGQRSQIVKRFISALRSVDLVLVHNEKTRSDLVAQGVPADKVRKIVIPVPVVDGGTEAADLGSILSLKPGDVVVGAAGFINRLKGTADAVEALALLPESYKLLIIGGLHPRGEPPNGDQGFLDGLLARVDALGLKDRVAITGYVDEDRLNAFVRACDVCVYPYDRVQYGNSSSAAVNNAFANHRAIVTYPTLPFQEINSLGRKYLEITEEFQPRALADSLRAIELDELASASKEYAERFSYPKVANQVADLYADLGR